MLEPFATMVIDIAPLFDIMLFATMLPFAIFGIVQTIRYAWRRYQIVKCRQLQREADARRYDVLNGPHR